MSHFSPAEFVDEAEGRLPQHRRAHLDACASCRQQSAEVRTAIAAAGDVDVPEPSPLFWEHFSARVSNAVQHATMERPAWWRHPAFAAACSIVLVLAAVAGVRDLRTRNRHPTEAAAPASLAAAPVNSTTADDPAWDLLADVASTAAEQDPRIPLAVRPSAIDRAVVDLSPDERQELQRLLRDEMKRTGA